MCKVMTWNEFIKSNFPMRDYDYPVEEGVIGGSIAAKVWGKSQNLLLYIDTDDGEYLKVSVWDHDDDYTGTKSAEIGQHIFLTLSESRSGRIRVDSVNTNNIFEDEDDYLIEGQAGSISGY